MANHTEQETQNLNKIPFYKKDFLAKYINYILKMLVIFGIALVISLTIRALFNLSPVWTFIMIFLILLAITPLTSKINFTIGYVIQREYDKFLERQTEKLFGKKNEN